MKKLLVVSLLVLSHVFAFGGDTPRGFMEISELEQAKAEALKKGKLIAIVAKGEDDACPRCAAALENGTKAIKSDCVMVFARVEDIKKSADLPAAVRAETKDAASGASVTFFVFDPGLKKFIAEAGLKELEDDKEATKAFKKKVDTARKDLAGK